ncbi:murein L,D-transpeptidase catalytic domain-containing protein [Halobacteriovorax sp.]|uniref:murein L,D-transpeptidase catalytic domain-containing protein n=1 Tax=Halobacteriovorax sp. TaxID=2020862 RepID=UPI003AF28246
MRLFLFSLLFMQLSILAEEVIPTSYESDPEISTECAPKDVLPEIQIILDAIDDVFEVTDNIYRGEECNFFEDFRDQGVPQDALKQALLYYRDHKNTFKNKNYISIADYSQSSTQKRFFLLNMKTGEVEYKKVSHGSGSLGGVKYSDATIKDGKVIKSSNHNGMMRRCRIPQNSRTRQKHDQWAMTRPGFFKTANFYMSASHDERVKGQRGWPTFSVNGRNYNGMRMEGLVDGVNDKAMSQGVVMHEAYYNRGKVMGRSFGCPAFVPGEGRDVMEKISNGSLYYSYVPIEGCREDHKKVLAEVEGWQQMCN